MWNVGQGQWFTWVQTHSCLHIDMGGEGKIIDSPVRTCSNKMNWLLLTHFDWDHIRWANKFAEALPRQSFCWLKLPHQKVPDKKLWFTNRLPKCEGLPNPKLFSYAYLKQSDLDANDSGTVFVINNEVLIPGDQSKQFEKDWLRSLKEQEGVSFNKLKTLIAPHHGSKTSSGKALLNSLKGAAVWVSARKRRYGHPHHSVLLRYKKWASPVMTTELWGHLRTGATFKESL